MNGTETVVAYAHAEPGSARYTVSGYAFLHGMRMGIVEAARHCVILTGICHDLGIEVKRICDPHFGMMNVYPEMILRDYFINRGAGYVKD